MKHPSQSGFTLLETLLYAFFLSFMLAGTLGAAFQIIQNSDRMSVQIAAQEDATFIIRKLDWALTGATGVSVPSATTLIVNRSSIPTTITFDVAGSDMRIRKDSADPIVLNGAGNPVTRASFIRYALPEGMRAGFTINGQSFTVTNYLRK